jgi:8-amino-7-oxononanoate synthase
MNEDFLDKKLEERKQQQSFRILQLSTGKIDFCSNDYLGLAGILKFREDTLPAAPIHGSTGSRLLAGNYTLIEEVEQLIAAFHCSPTGLLFNSGYDANLGILSCVPQRGDSILYDYLSHASIRDGIRLSLAQSFSFLHNDVADLEKKIQTATGTIFVVTESVFSMDGDRAPLTAIADLCKKYNAQLMVDEAHATGVIGHNGEGLVQHLQLENDCLARVHTFGKALGCHGAIVLGSEKLRQYLINFCRPFIYTTALPPSTVLAIQEAYRLFPDMKKERQHIQQLVHQFTASPLLYRLQKSDTPIQTVIIPGNDRVKQVASALQHQQLDVRPILYPTVPKGSERLRIIIHAFNTSAEVNLLAKALA